MVRVGQFPPSARPGVASPAPALHLNGQARPPRVGGRPGVRRLRPADRRPRKPTPSAGPPARALASRLECFVARDRRQPFLPLALPAPRERPRLPYALRGQDPPCPQPAP